MVRERSWGSRLFDVVNHGGLGLVALICLIPFIHVFAVSLSNRGAVEGNLVTLWPIGFNTANYETIFRDAQFVRSFGISVARVLTGAALNLLIVVLTAYPLSLQWGRGFRGQQAFKWLLLFAMLFDGGLIPRYLIIRNLGLLDTFWVLILPGSVQVFYVIVMMNFFRNLPRELAEAATVDGASHWNILFRIYLPLSLPALATIGLFSAVFHWNSWFDGLIYINDPTNFPLQSYLVGVGAAQFQQQNPQFMLQVSSEALRAAQLFVATIPVLLVYPFLQRYFVAGLTLGSVKQ